MSCPRHIKHEEYHSHDDHWTGKRSWLHILWRIVPRLRSYYVLLGEFWLMNPMLDSLIVHQYGCYLIYLMKQRENSLSTKSTSTWWPLWKASLSALQTGAQSSGGTTLYSFCPENRSQRVLVETNAINNAWESQFLGHWQSHTINKNVCCCNTDGSPAGKVHVNPTERLGAKDRWTVTWHHTTANSVKNGKRNYSQDFITLQ